VLALRSIHNVSGGGIVRKVPPSVAFDRMLRTECFELPAMARPRTSTFGQKPTP
jgi:hypothetical protein